MIFARGLIHSYAIDYQFNYCYFYYILNYFPNDQKVFL